MNTPSRADFTTLASSMAGSLVLLTRGCSTSLPGEEHGENFSSSAWIVIHPDDTIAFFSNRTEMGQGVILDLPTLVAEELDVALDRIRYEVAQPDPKYFYPSEESMFTGASMSLRTSWHPLRQAAATARAMLVEAAAKNWNVSAASLRTENGVVTDPASNRSATYGALATQAAALPVPQDVSLKSPDEYRLIRRPRGWANWACRSA